MSDTILYLWPGTCARATAIALEECGQNFEMELVRLPKGEHKSESYKAINPKSKVPALKINGEILTENAAMLTYLHERFPDAGLLPTVSSLEAKANQSADLIFCAATLHPIVTRLCMPQLLGDEAAKSTLTARAHADMTNYLSMIQSRLSNQQWWYGDQWSIVDGYLYWIFTRIMRGGYDLAPFVRLQKFNQDSEKRPAVQNILVREQALMQQAIDEGVIPKPK